MITTSDNATQKSIILPTRSVHRTSFLWALCHELVRSTAYSPQTVQACPTPRSPTSVPTPPAARGLASSRSLGRGGRSSPRAACQASWPPPPGWEQNGESWWLAGAVVAPTGMPEASTAIERLMPCYPLSTEFLPAFCPPQGALVRHPSTATSEGSRPMRRS
jgi:hypothetical protein